LKVLKKDKYLFKKMWEQYLSKLAAARYDKM